MNLMAKETKLAALLSAVFLLSIMSGIAQGKKGKGKAAASNKVTEIFHVSRVGQSGAAENRETLIAVFGSIAEEYNRKIKKEQARNPRVFKGERVRVIKRLDEKAANGSPLYLTAYGGSPSVMSVSGKANLKPGQLTPPLIISEAGEHSTTVTRQIRIKSPKSRGPELEVVSDSNVPTFFGIPIDTGATPRSSATYKTVTETKSFKKFQAKVSTERIDNRPIEMTTAMFTAQLKNGEVFDASRIEERRCRECVGFGRILGTSKIRGPDGKIPCPDCKEAGKIKWNVTYRVMW